MNGDAAPASSRKIVLATFGVLVAATVILFVAILPAEYGIDPLGTGRALGLTALAGVDAAPPPPAAATAPQSTLRQDTYAVELRPFEGVEYKYRLEQGAALVYAWEATAPVGFEFHGEPDGAPAKYFDSYSKGEAAEGHGGFVAAKAGIHGWFWENKTAVRVTVTLRSSGFYSASTEYRDGDRINRDFSAKAGK